MRRWNTGSSEFSANAEGGFMSVPTLRKWTAIGFLILLLNAAYIWAFAFPTVFYMTNVLAHLGLGLALSLMLLRLLGRDAQLRSGALPAVGFFLIAFGLGAYLAVGGNTVDRRWALVAHIVTALLGIVVLFAYVWRLGKSQRGGWLRFRNSFAICLAVLVILPAASAIYSRTFPSPTDHIRNPQSAPLSMSGEGGGPKSPFFPSSAKTNVGGIIPSNFFMDSTACGECHKDIYEQWKSSMHHFASFNNQFYRKSIEYMQSVVGTQPSKWCAGCHDHAVFFNGRFDRPVKEQIDTAEARAGLACTSCHAIVHVDSSMGNGGFTIAYPPLHEFVTSKNKFIHALDYFATFLNPEPHRRTFMKPFMREDTSEFCSGCHKVHLDVPVNQYRWFRGFNDYDNWQASGVSGQGARSFYYPMDTSTCADCHMPLVPSKDPGNRGGKVHSHRFPAANTAVPFVNRDEEQLRTTEQFLKSGFISVDVFSVSPIEEAKNQPQMLRRIGESPQAMSSIAAGEEAEQSGQGFIREVGKLAAPIDQSAIVLRPGAKVHVDVVVRTRKIGHSFPGGTLDAFDIWLDVDAKDATGKTIFWSGRAEDGGRGPVDPGAHFYRSYQLDGDGNPINKRNAWQSRSVLYVHQIPPGAADVAHYRLTVPPGAKGPITIAARLNYRKFSNYYTQFSYAGEPKPGQAASLINPAFNSLEYNFDPHNIPSNVSGEIKGAIPVLPIVTLAESKADIAVGAPGTETQWKPIVNKTARERWNDWGIGLLLQGDLKGAEYAFRRVTEAEPEYADGWLNLARALIQEGETDAAKPFLDHALQINDHLGRVHYFKALVEKADGDYEGALRSLTRAASLYPRDRVVLNQIGRVLFLKRQYKESLSALARVAAVDPEDVQMHYQAMLCYRGLGMRDEANREAQLFQRFKAEESSQSITAKRRLISPEDNNERQNIHDHTSVDLREATNLVSPEAPRSIPKTLGGGAQ
jgi:tetratricopeptide (TPR) repeat protein